MALPLWAIVALVNTASSVVSAWTSPDPQIPEQRETAQEKWFQSRVDMGAALVKRKEIAGTMASTILGRSPMFFRNFHFDEKMKEIKSTLPAGSGHSNNIAILQTAKMYDDFVEDTTTIATRTKAKEVFEPSPTPKLPSEAKSVGDPGFSPQSSPLKEQEKKGGGHGTEPSDMGNPFENTNNDKNDNGIPDDEEA